MSDTANIESVDIKNTCSNDNLPCTNCHFFGVMNIWTLLTPITFAEPIVKHAVLLLHSGACVVLAILCRRRCENASIDGTTANRHTSPVITTAVQNQLAVFVKISNKQTMFTKRY